MAVFTEVTLTKDADTWREILEAIFVANNQSPLASMDLKAFCAYRMPRTFCKVGGVPH